MKKTTLSLTILLFAIVVISTQSCSKEDDTVNEFVATNASFANFMGWSLDATAQGPDPALGGMAHGGNDSSVTRNVYFKDGQNPVNGSYPTGTIIIKHSFNPIGSVDEYTAMVKRGNGFNDTKGDWEFFMLANNGNIATDSTGMEMRGANLMNGMCGGCHNAASANDFIFSK